MQGARHHLHRDSPRHAPIRERRQSVSTEQDNKERLAESRHQRSLERAAAALREAVSAEAAGEPAFRGVAAEELQRPLGQGQGQRVPGADSEAGPPRAALEQVRGFLASGGMAGLAGEETGAVARLGLHAFEHPVELRPGRRGDLAGTGRFVGERSLINYLRAFLGGVTGRFLRSFSSSAACVWKIWFRWTS